MVTREPIVKRYYEALDEGKILGVKCKRCGSYEFPPLPVCNNCSSTDMEWAEVSGEGKLLEFTMPAAMTKAPEWEHMKPYCFGNVQLNEGPSLTSVVLGVSDENEADIDKNLPFPVEAETVQWDGFKSVAFRIKK